MNYSLDRCEKVSVFQIEKRIIDRYTYSKLKNINNWGIKWKKIIQ